MPPLPAEPSDLTPTWLSEALGVEVTAVESLDHANATNQRARIGLTYAKDGAGPATLFVKLAPTDPVHREMIGALGMGLREVQFYADAAPTIEVPVPKAWFAGADDEGGFTLLLEDLGARGCRFASQGEWGVPADAAAGALEDLARMHGRFTEAAARDAVAPWLRHERPTSSEATAGRMRWVLDEYGDRLTEPYKAVGELYVKHHAAIDTLWHAGPQTMIHGDPHIGNVYLDGEAVGFLDWGLCRVSTPLRDVSYFLTMTVDPEERRKAERDLLQLYIDALAAAGGPAITFDEAWAVHRMQASYTVIATFLAFMPSYMAGDGQGLGVALRTRAELALEDLDVVDALTAALS